jgi:hypothetical protein
MGTVCSHQREGMRNRAVLSVPIFFSLYLNFYNFPETHNLLFNNQLSYYYWGWKITASNFHLPLIIMVVKIIPLLH